MSLTLDHWSVTERETLSQIFNAIAHPTRLAIIDLLGDSRHLSVTEIYTYIDDDQSTISHHLRIMRTWGVLGCERQGNQVFYFLKNQALTTLLDCISQPGMWN